MVAIAREVAPGRWRASAGRYFEDFTVGGVYEHRPGRTISEADNTWFTLLTMNTHPLHFDAAYAAETEFKKPLVNSTLTLAIVTVRTTGKKSDGTVFMSFERSCLIPMRGHAVDDKLDY